MLKKFVVAIAILVITVGLFVVLRLAFAGEISVSPVAFSFGSISVRWYGLIIAAAILVGIPWFIQRAEARGIERTRADTVVWWAVLGGIVGARLLYVVQNLDVFGADPGSIVMLWDGGLSIHGAILGGALVAALVARMVKVDFWTLADAAVPPILLGMILGRFGNFTNAELFGPPTDVPWKMFVPDDSRPEGMFEIAFYHPTFLYDAMLNSVLLCILIRTERRIALSERSESNGRRPGTLFLGFIAGISLTRFIVEFWRLGEPAALGLSSAQLVSLLLLGASVSLLLCQRPGSDRSFQGRPRRTRRL